MDRHFRFLAPRTDIDSRARFLTQQDLPALIELEHEKWEADQAASPAELQARIEAHPDLALGAFCPLTGNLLASLFLKPVPDGFYRYVSTWSDCTSQPAPPASISLFGLSLSSRHQSGVDALFNFFWPYALKRGWRHIYLGSPMPGLSGWRRRHPHGCVNDYAYARRAGRPLDPQLRYYHRRGFTKIVGVKPGYFPHQRSLDYGVLLRGSIPLSTLAPLWAALPLPLVRNVTQPLAKLI